MILIPLILSPATESTLQRAHRLAGKTLLDGAPVPRRVLVQDRRLGTYIISCVTGDDGVINFTRLPPQILANPYVVTCFDDSETGYGNALVFDRVYQVDDDGNPPQV